MPRRGHPLGTVGHLVEERLGLIVSCDGCRHRHTFTVADLSARWSPETEVRHILERVVCTRCGGRWPAIDCTISAEGGR